MFEDFKYSLTAILNAMEGIALARLHNAGDSRMLDGSSGKVIPRYWVRLQPFVLEYRKVIPDAWEGLERVVTDVWHVTPESPSQDRDRVREIIEDR